MKRVFTLALSLFAFEASIVPGVHAQNRPSAEACCGYSDRLARAEAALNNVRALSNQVNARMRAVGVTKEEMARRASARKNYLRTMERMLDQTDLLTSRRLTSQIRLPDSAPGADAQYMALLIRSGVGAPPEDTVDLAQSQQDAALRQGASITAASLAGAASESAIVALAHRYHTAAHSSHAMAALAAGYVETRGHHALEHAMHADEPNHHSAGTAAAIETGQFVMATGLAVGLGPIAAGATVLLTATAGRLAQGDEMRGVARTLGDWERRTVERARALRVDLERIETLVGDQVTAAVANRVMQFQSATCPGAVAQIPDNIVNDMLVSDNPNAFAAMLGRLDYMDHQITVDIARMSAANTPRENSCGRSADQTRGTAGAQPRQPAAEAGNTRRAQ